MTMFVHILPEISLHKVSNDISNVDHFVLITNIVSKKLIDTQPYWRVH